MIQTNISLKPYNTFGLDVVAKHFIHAESLDSLKEGLNLFNDKDPLILSGGSNILLTRDPDRVILIDFKGIEIIKEKDCCVFVKVQAGEGWHDFVVWAIENNFGGVENLSLIPGKVGAAPIQNIGAYGVEVSDVFVNCSVIDIPNRKVTVLNREDCNFGYRDSIFKQKLKGNCIITDVTFCLSKSGHHKINTSYGSLQSFLRAKNISIPTIKEVSDTVISIRSSKLPDPRKLRNSGSFFKNILVDKNTLEKLLMKYPDMPHVSTKDGFKIASAWLIEFCGFKGFRRGDAGVHSEQALVLVNHAAASGKDILMLSNEIIKKVRDTFGLSLEREVVVF